MAYNQQRRLGTEEETRINTRSAPKPMRIGINRSYLLVVKNHDRYTVYELIRFIQLELLSIDGVLF